MNLEYYSSKSLNSGNKNERTLHIDLSPICEDKIHMNPIWFNLKKKTKEFQCIDGKKGDKIIDNPYRRWGHSSLYFNNGLLIFGGRHSTRSLVNIYAFDLENLFWYKIESLGQTPAERDSHCTIIVGNELICFGGSGCGKKLNDLWSFNLLTRKWSRISSYKNAPCSREGHNHCVIKNKYLMIYGGLDEDDNSLNDMYFLDLRTFIWYKCDISGDIPSSRDSQSCSLINETCYIFGGQGDDDKLFNEIYTISFEINETQLSFKAKWEKEEVNGMSPPERTSHSSTVYKQNYFIVIGGEGYNNSNYISNLISN